MLVGLVLSPTRVLAQHLIQTKTIKNAQGIWCWNGLFYALAAAFYVTTLCSGDKEFGPWWTIPTLLLVVWRINELVAAFSLDALDKVRSGRSSLNLSREQLITLLAAGYVETILQFGIAHFCIDRLCGGHADAGSYTKPFRTVLDAAYFSGVTVTTTGFGDFAPTGGLARIATIYEALVGIALIAGALAAYLSFQPSSDDRTPQ